MKLEDVKVGQYLQDQYGNQFKVLTVAPRDAQCVKLECTYFNQRVAVGDGIYFESTGQVWWVVKEQACIRQSLSEDEKKTAAYKADCQLWLLVETDTSADITLESLEVL